MKHRLLFAFLLGSIIICFPIQAEELTTTNETKAQLRFDFSYNLKLPKNMSLQFFEDLRLQMLPFSESTIFNLSITSVTFSYSPIEYLKIDGGYMLKLYGASSAAKWQTHWNNPNNFFRHRVFLGATASYSVDNWKLSFRERALCDMRFDEINPLTTNHYLFTLRHYLLATRSIKQYGLSPYLWLELGNTLNAPTNYTPHNRQYLERARLCVGTRWKTPNTTIPLTLNFFYLYEWSSSYSLMLCKYKHLHALGIAAEL